MATLKAVKKELRQKVRRILSEIPIDAIATQTSNAVQTLFSMPEYQGATRISVFLSMPNGEISTAGIVRDALNQKKKVFVPYTYKLENPQGHPASVMDMLELKSLSDFESLGSDKWGIPTPSKDSVAERENCWGMKGLSHRAELEVEKGHEGLDLIVMPGMAFDTELGRLGHGKGYYDYFLDRCHRQCNRTGSKMPFLVGLALKEQLLAKEQPVPMDSTDWRLDALITGDGNTLRPNV